MTRLVPPVLHLSGRPSTTAEAVTIWRALELDRPPRLRIVSDEFAPMFLTPQGRAALVGARFGAAPMLQFTPRHGIFGVGAYVLCRHRFIDEQLLAALEGDIEQVVVLGAGYDSRAYRFAAQLAGRAVYEVDLAPLSRRKAAIVAKHPEVFGASQVRRVEIDFRTQELRGRLEAARFAVAAPTFVVWEGVAPYLSRDAAGATLTALHEVCGAGSIIAMDMWDGAGGPGVAASLRRLGARALALVGEPVTFGLVPSLVGAFLERCGFVVTDLAAGDDLAARWSTDGRRCEPSLYVLSAKLT